MKRNKRLRMIDAICNHVINNKKEYVLVTLIFLVGIFLGVMFINNIQEAQMAEITEYLKSFTEKLKNTEKLETYSILKTTILENVILAITLWFFGTTVIGIPIVFGIILLRIFNCINNNNNGSWKRYNICINNAGTTKHNIYSCNNSHRSKSDLNYINQ